MKIKNPERFLKVAAFTIGLAVIVGGTFTNEKNSDFISRIDANLNSASATNLENYSIAMKIGACQQTAATQASKRILVEVESLDDFLSGETTLDTKFIDPITAAIQGGRLSSKIIYSGDQYEFTVNDGQTNFWECLLENHPLLKVLENESAATSDFLSKTAAFSGEIKQYSFIVEEQKKVDQFLNFVDAPNGETILETTALNSEGEVFFKIFEIEHADNYSKLRQALRDRVGVTNLRPAVFGADSYYWMWGENDKMAASVFYVSGRIFGVSYQTIHFKSIRRMIESLQSSFKFLSQKVELVKSLNIDSEELTIGEFEKMTDEDFGPEVSRQLKNFDAGASDLSANILEISPLEQFEELNEVEEIETVEDVDLESLKVPEIAEDLEELIPASL